MANRRKECNHRLSLSDRDLAIKNILHSAFSHSGQKCSATGLLLLEEEVYQDARFMIHYWMLPAVLWAPPGI